MSATTQGRDQQEQVSLPLSTRVTPFRSVLMNEFQVSDDLFSTTRNGPVHSTFDLQNDDQLLHSILEDNPMQVIRFKTFKRQTPESIGLDPRLRRVQNIYKLPPGIWARWLVSRWWYTWIIFITIVLSCILMAIESSLQEADYPSLFLAVRIISSLCTLIFIVDVVLRWTDSFMDYWKNGWNVYDFVLTVASLPDLLSTLIPAGIFIRRSYTSVTRTIMRITRSLRVFRLVSYFPSLRVIVRTAFQALGSLVYLIILLFIAMYLFAVVGLTFFDEYAEMNRPESFKWGSLGGALLSLFQILTYDRWYISLREIMSVYDAAYQGLAAVYFILWVILGGFIFQNIFVGIMVQYFQDIKSEMAQARAIDRRERRVQKLQRRLGRKMAQRSRRELQALQLAQAAAVEARNKKRQSHHHGHHGHPVHAEQEDSDVHMRQQLLMADDAAQSGDLQHLVKLLTIENAATKTTNWPRNLVLEYLRRMEQLQENIMEQQELFRLVGVALHAAMGEDERRLAKGGVVTRS